jgi:methenyltetrahydromethanopterin cyclohydrolase
MGGAMTDLGMNERAARLADRIVERAVELRVVVYTLASGARVIDAGIDTPGGLGAGLMLAELCMGGLGHVEYAPITIAGDSWAGVQVWTDYPAESCMASQYGGWAIAVNNYFAIGSGPLRAKARVEKELYARLGYEEAASRGVMVLEGRTLPTDEVATWVATKAGLAPSALIFAIAPTASVAGGVQVVARVLETGLHKMETLGFDVTKVMSAEGTAPVPPVAKNDLRAMGRTNDCVLYGGQARFTMRGEDDELAKLARQLPATTSRDYGKPFYETFKRYDNDFYKVDPLLFSPAEVWLTNVTSGRTFHAGLLNPDVLRASLYDSE